MEACGKKQSILASAPLAGNSYELILALQNEVGERGESPSILGVQMAVETRLGAMREVLRQIAGTAERAGFMNQRNDCFRSHGIKFFFFQHAGDKLARVAVAVFHRVNQGQRDFTLFQVAENRFAELLR